LKGRRILAVALTLCLTASAVFADQSWQGVQIMPKSPQVELRSDGGTPVSIYDISWPATVQETNGRFLRIQDDGGYSRNQAGGWIYCDDVVKSDDARDYYSNQLRRGETAWLHWMRGISWEALNEPGIAMMDYQSALQVDPQTALDDVHIRLGRLLAQQQLLNGRGRYDVALRAVWEKEFETAKRINPNRPQLYYEWGLALSQACECTQHYAQNSPGGGQASGSSDGNSTRSKVSQGEKMRGLDLDEDETIVSPSQSKPSATDTAGRSPSSAAAPQTQASGSSVASEAIAAGASVGPTTAGGTAAVESLGYYLQAERLNPRWWRIPLARAELMLNQCDQESPEGERVVITNGKPEFFAQLSGFNKRRISSAPSAAPPQEALAMRDVETPSGGPAKNSAQQSNAAPVPPYMTDVLATAMNEFNQAISLNPNALDAYRDRAELLRIMNQLEEAHRSATIACKLCNYRQPGSLRTLAQINYDLTFYQTATDYALRAAELASGDERQRYLHLWDKCGKHCSGDDAKLVAASEKAGYVASPVLRDVDADSKQPDANRPKSPGHIEPPPGFMSRSGSAMPD
jgi:tetratricopeptide (TPR) repeat protein